MIGRSPVEDSNFVQYHIIHTFTRSKEKTFPWPTLIHISSDLLGNDFKWKNHICNDQLISPKLLINYNSGETKTTTSNMNLH